MTEKARLLHEELKVLDTDALYSIMDAVTDLVTVPPDDLGEALAEMFKDTGIQFSNLESLINEITSCACPCCACMCTSVSGTGHLARQGGFS